MNIEELYKKSFTDDEMNVDDKVWKKINERLNSASSNGSSFKQNVPKRTPSALKYLSGALCVIAIAGIIYLMLPKDIDNHSEKIAQTPVENKERSYNGQQSHDEANKTNEKNIHAIEHNRITTVSPRGNIFDEFEITDNEDVLPIVNTDQFKFQHNKADYSDNSKPQSSVAKYSEKKTEDNSNEATESKNKVAKESVKPDIFCPNLLTPNGDGMNDCLTIANIEKYPDNSIVIYDRYGKQVYKASHYNNEFCGENLESGAYIYTLNIRFDGKIHTFNFSLTVIK